MGRAPWGMRHALWITVFVTWTAVIWGQRISNIWRDQDLDTGAQLGRTILPVTFVVLALWVAVALWRGPLRALVWSVFVLGVWTAVVWPVRAAAILLGDWSAGFKVVHTALALVSIALAYAAYRSLRRSPQHRA